MESRNQISLLIIKSILEELDPTELNELNEWMKHAENKRLYGEITKHRNFRELYREYIYLRSRKPNIKKNIKRRRGRLKLYALSRYAAVFLLPFIASYFLFTLKVNEDVLTQTDCEIKTEIVMNAPTLSLPDGGKIVLHEKLGKALISECNISINDSLREIRYDKKDGNENEQLRMNVLETPKCCEYKLFLSDGTMVRLNAMSKLRYPEKFIGTDRLIELEGEAYFEVTKDSKRPFLVKTKNQTVKVLGTKFNINSYNAQIYTTLVEGSVEVSLPSAKKTEYKDKKILVSGMQSAVQNNVIHVKNVDVKDYISWINGEFIFRKQRLEDILTAVGRWYDFEVFYANDEVKDRLFSVKVKKFEQAEELFKLLEKAYEVEFVLEDKKLSVRKKDN